jgi:hypothetical protein
MAEIHPRPLRFHDDLDASVLFRAKRLVKLGPLFKRGAMRDDERGIDVAAFDGGERRL